MSAYNSNPIPEINDGQLVLLRKLVKLLNDARTGANPLSFSIGGGGVQETPTITRVTANGSVAAGARSVTFIASASSPVMGGGSDFSGSILGIDRQPGESITITASAGNTLGAIAYLISGGSLDIVKTV